MKARDAFEAVNGDTEVGGFGDLLYREVVPDSTSPIPDKFMDVCQRLRSADDFIQEVIQGSL